MLQRNCYYSQCCVRFAMSSGARGDGKRQGLTRESGGGANFCHYLIISILASPRAARRSAENFLFFANSRAAHLTTPHHTHLHHHHRYPHRYPAPTMSSLFKTLTTDPDSKPDDNKHPKNRLLVLSSRGVTYRHRHLLNDLVALLPQARKDAKLDTKSQLHLLNEVAELYNCNGVLFFEARKRQDLYMWISRVPNGPCVKFHVQNRGLSPALGDESRPAHGR